MRQIIKTTITLLTLAITVGSASAQTAPKKPQIDMAKINRHRDQVLQKVAEQQSQLKYAPMNPNHVPVSQNKISDSSAILHNKQGTVRAKEK
jgi:GrpB-like predicted nucleotidyltransferase (UPF0157 family)